MFDSWISDFKRSINNAITEYVLIALAVVPFLVAAGFATAAVVIWLTASMSTTAAFLVVSAGFALIGMVVLIIARSYEKPSQPSEPQDAVQSDVAEASLLSGSMGTIAGLIFAHPGVAWSTLRVLVRNLPALIAGSILGGMLFSDARAPRAVAREDQMTPGE